MSHWQNLRGMWFGGWVKRLPQLGPSRIMEVIPTDVLLLIFEAYTQDLYESPTRLLTVCRRWNNIATCSPTLWSRINISINSIQKIPSILKRSDQGLRLYLARSQGPNGQVPLDIKIEWRPAKAADHLSTCLVTPQDVIDCPQSRCNLISTRQAQLSQLLHQLAGPNRHPLRSTWNSEPRIFHWMTLTLDFKGFFDRGTPKGPISLEPLGSGEYSVLPHLDSFIIKHADIPHFRLIAPELRTLELNDARLGGEYSVMGWLKKITFRDTNNFDAIKWDACNRLMILEVSGIDGWTLPSSTSFYSLSTIVIHPCASTRTLDSIGEVFNESKPLPTLVVLGMSPEGLSYLLAYSHKLRCHNLNITSHCSEWGKTYAIASKWAASKGVPLTEKEYRGLIITDGDVKATDRILREMKLRGARVNPLDDHMQKIIVLARLMYPDA